MLDILAQFDPLGLGALVGSILFLAALIWVLLDNRSFEDLNQKTLGEPAVRAGRAEASSAELDAPAGTVAAATSGETAPPSTGPGRPSRPRRAA